jgi:hypothetical protein
MHPEVAIALCFDDLKTSVGYQDTNIDPAIFNQAINDYNYMGINTGTWQNIANLGKFSNKTDSPYSTQSPCSPQSKQN